MYNSQEIASRIKLMAKQKKINVGDMLSSCDLGINTISKIAKDTDILTKNFAKIADYLDCSVDYLLGRTDNPVINKEHSQATSSMHINDVQNSGVNGVIGNAHAPVTITIKNGEEHTIELTKQELDLLESYKKADGRKQFEIMKMVYGSDENK